MPYGIVHVHWAFPPTTGGVESHLSDLARLQRAAAHDVVVVTGEPAPIASGPYEILSTPLLDLRALRRGGYGSGYASDLRAFLSRLFARRRVDIVHGHDLHHFAPEPALVLDELRRRHGFALHHTFHETWPDVLAKRPVYRGWDGNYAVSCFVQEGCVRRLGFRPRHFPLAVDTERFQAGTPVLCDDAPPVLLHPARLLPWKGVHVSVEALALLRSRGVPARLLITDTQRIADWHSELADYRWYVRSLVSRLGVEDCVEFVRASYAEMPQLYRRADIVLYPTVGDEPFGLVPLEGMASARPVVATASGGIAETVVPGETGYIVPRDDAPALAERLAVLLADRAAARAMGERGRRHVVQHYDLSSFAKRLEHCYRSSAASP